MSASRAFFQAIDRARRERKLAELVDVAGIDCDDDEMDDRDDEIGDELAEREEGASEDEIDDQEQQLWDLVERPR